MGLVLKYVKVSAKGHYTYRRAVPKHLQSVIGKREFKRSLGHTERDALKAYPVIHNHFLKQERQAEMLLRGKGSEKVSTNSELERYERLVQQIEELGFNPYESERDETGQLIDQAHRDVTAEAIIDAYPRDPATGDPVGITEADERLIRSLYSKVPNVPAPTLLDAKRLYLEHKRTSDQVDEKKQRQRSDRVIAHAIDALGQDRKVTEIRRLDARKIVEHFQDGLGCKPATAQRYLNDLKAIVNFAIRETELGISNPFSGLSIKVSGSRKDDKRSFTTKELEAVRKQIDQHANDELRWIWGLLELTGCRLSEIRGLKKAEVFLKGVEIPFLRIQFNENRRLKNPASIRDIPLTKKAVSVIQQALEASDDSSFVFPHYGSKMHKDLASAALQKHVRAVVKDKAVSTHSLRHTMADKLRLAGVHQEVISLILGHAGKGMTERYGGPEARLKLMAEAFSKLPR
nr:tyrosine-type recombinase/integrase [uncultured Cohaesibacter sp.]